MLEYQQTVLTTLSWILSGNPHLLTGNYFIDREQNLEQGYSFGVVRPSVHSVRPSGTISQYLLVRFYSFLVQMISTMDSQTSNKFGQNQPLNT